MKKYVVIYQFLCPNCKHIMVGKIEVDALHPPDAAVRFSAQTLPCRVCHQTVETKAVVRFLIYAVQDSESSEAATNPAVPLT
jgi:hypothetical protein